MYAATWPVPINAASVGAAMRQLLIFEPEAQPPWQSHPEREAAAADEAAAAAAGEHRSRDGRGAGALVAPAGSRRSG
jgi:hypothetical protein